MANKEKGFTLIEILLTMAILSIVGVLAISLLLQTTKTRNTVTSRINLSSEANIILAAIEKNIILTINYVLAGVNKIKRPIS